MKREKEKSNKIRWRPCYNKIIIILIVVCCRLKLNGKPNRFVAYMHAFTFYGAHRLCLCSRTSVSVSVRVCAASVDARRKPLSLQTNACEGNAQRVPMMILNTIFWVHNVDIMFFFSITIVSHCDPNKSSVAWWMRIASLEREKQLSLSEESNYTLIFSSISFSFSLFNR